MGCGLVVIPLGFWADPSPSWKEMGALGHLLLLLNLPNLPTGCWDKHPPPQKRRWVEIGPKPDVWQNYVRVVSAVVLSAVVLSVVTAPPSLPPLAFGGRI